MSNIYNFILYLIGKDKIKKIYSNLKTKNKNRH